MAVSSYFVLLLLYSSQLVFGANRATFENVTLTLTTRWTIYYINDTAPMNNVRIRYDFTLVEYVNNQPMDIVLIQNQDVPELTENSVANLPNVTEVAITGSGLRSIVPGAFRNLPSLEYLNLSGNLLEEIQNGVFANLTRLDTIHLENNRISKLGDRVFGNMPGLGHIFIDDNRISTWSSDWFSGSRVESVHMSHNLVEELPADAFKYFVELSNGSTRISLWYLVLSNNRLKKIDPNAFRDLEEIMYLNLQNNFLEELPPGGFRTVKSINNLVLNNNSFTNIDFDKVFKNTELTYVKLQDNRLSCLPVDIVNITEIYSLNIDGNPVTCECVKSWETWQNQTKKNIIALDNIKDNCIEK